MIQLMSKYLLDLAFIYIIFWNINYLGKKKMMITNLKSLFYMNTKLYSLMNHHLSMNLFRFAHQNNRFKEQYIMESLLNFNSKTLTSQNINSNQRL